MEYTFSEYESKEDGGSFGLEIVEFLTSIGRERVF